MQSKVEELRQDLK
jgi:hypothetical protein